MRERCVPFAKVERRADGTIVTIADALYAAGAITGPFVRRLRLAPSAAPNQLLRAPDTPQAEDQHGAERR